MWVGDRALGGGLDTHRSQVGGEEMAWGGPHQAEGVLTHTDRHFRLQRVIGNWEERAKNKRSSWVW